MELVGVTDRMNFQIGAKYTAAGTTRSAELRSELPTYSLLPPPSQIQVQEFTYKNRDMRSIGNNSTRMHINPEALADDEFGDDYFNDLEVMNAGKFGSLTVFRV